MSTDYHLACHDCKRTIHVAQDGMSGFGFYSGEPDCMKALRQFFLDHQMHALQLVPEQIEYDLQDSGYERIEWQGPLEESALVRSASELSTASKD